MCKAFITSYDCVLNSHLANFITCSGSFVFTFYKLVYFTGIPYTICMAIQRMFLKRTITNQRHKYDISMFNLYWKENKLGYLKQKTLHWKGSVMVSLPILKSRYIVSNLSWICAETNNNTCYLWRVVSRAQHSV